jgi:hypothetical protein
MSYILLLNAMWALCSWCYTLGHILVHALYCTFISRLCVPPAHLLCLLDLPWQLPLSKYLAVTSWFDLPLQTFPFHLTFSCMYSLLSTDSFRLPLYRYVHAWVSSRPFDSFFFTINTLSPRVPSDTFSDSWHIFLQYCYKRMTCIMQQLFLDNLLLRASYKESTLD